MTLSSKIRTGRHCVFLLHVHLVFVTKYRRQVFTKTILAELKDIFEGVCLSYEAVLAEFDGEGDHVHLLVNYPTKVQLSKLVNSLKTASSRIIRKRGHPTVEKSLWGNQLWSPSYFAGSCGGAPLDIVKQYIQGQKTPV